MSARLASGVSTHRFYEDALTAAERTDLPAALELEGVDDEIAFLRLRLKAALEEHPEDLPLMFKGLELLTRMVVRRYHLSKKDAQAFQLNQLDVVTEFVFLMPYMRSQGVRHD